MGYRTAYSTLHVLRASVPLLSLLPGCALVYPAWLETGAVAPAYRYAARCTGYCQALTAPARLAQRSSATASAYRFWVASGTGRQSTLLVHSRAHCLPLSRPCFAMVWPLPLARRPRDWPPLLPPVPRSTASRDRRHTRSVRCSAALADGAPG